MFNVHDDMRKYSWFDVYYVCKLRITQFIVFIAASLTIVTKTNVYAIGGSWR